MSASLARVPKVSYKIVDAGRVDYATLQRKLSPFQLEKLTYLFRQLFDCNQDGVIDAADIQALREKMIQFAGWNENSEEALFLKDSSNVFLECLLDQVKAEHGACAAHLENRTWQEALKPSKMAVKSCNLSQWLNMWAKFCDRAAGINDFPVYVQLLPKLIFKMIAGSGNFIEKENLRKFYEDFIGLKGKDLEDTVENGFKIMTANGDYALNQANYDLIFANYLLGRTIYGPGKYIFGCFDNSDSKKKYQIILE